MWFKIFDNGYDEKSFGTDEAAYWEKHWSIWVGFVCTGWLAAALQVFRHCISQHYPETVGIQSEIFCMPVICSLFQEMVEINFEIAVHIHFQICIMIWLREDLFSIWSYNRSIYVSELYVLCHISALTPFIHAVFNGLVSFVVPI